MSSRSRFRNSLTAAGSYAEWGYHTSCADTSWHRYGSEIPFYAGTYEEMSDTVVPNFVKRRAAGEIFFNGMSKIKQQYIPGNGLGGYTISVANSCGAPAFKAEFDCRGDWTTYFLPQHAVKGVPVPAYLGHFTQSDENQYVNEVATRMLSQRGRSDSNLFETLAEFDQVRRLLDAKSNYVFRLLNAVGHKRSKMGRLPAVLLNEVASGYLAFRYGIKPLVGDIVGIISGLEKKVGKVRRTTRAMNGVTGQNSRVFSKAYGVHNMQVAQSNTHEMIIRAMSLDEVHQTLIGNIGFTGKGLLTLPWELTTASFVADWFANIGDFIGAITPAFGWNNLGSCVTVSHNVESIYTLQTDTNTNPGAYTHVRPFTGSYTVKVNGKRRFSVPSPRVAIRTDFGFDKFTRTADAYALIGVTIRKLFT